MTTVAVPDPVVLNLPAGVSSSRARCRSSHASSASSTVTPPSAGSHSPRGTNGGRSPSPRDGSCPPRILCGVCRCPRSRLLPCGDAAHRTATAQGSFGPIFGMATGRGGRQHSRQHSIITTSGRRRCAARILAQDRRVRPQVGITRRQRFLAVQCPLDRLAGHEMSQSDSEDCSKMFGC